MKAAEYIKFRVDNMGVTYTAISKKTGIPVDTISKSLRGKRKLPADEMVAICNAVNINLCDFKNLAGG